VQFRDRGFEHRLSSGVLESSDPPHERAGRVESKLHIHDAVGDRLERADRTTELRATLHERDRVVQLPLHAADVHREDRAPLPFHRTVEARRAVTLATEERV
jgi:hypothetical protein